MIMMVILVLSSGSVYAEYNNDGASATSEAFAKGVKDVVAVLLNTTGGVLGTVIAPLVNVFSLLIFLILYLIFVAGGLTGGTASTVLSFPFPDQIVFNRIPLLDPNFINPAKDSIGGEMTGGLFKDLYASFFVLAGTIFAIAAMIIGIKLALSSLAAEKAQYKKALNTWIVGIVLLFTVHYLLAGMFYLNEVIVKAVYHEQNNIEVKIDLAENVPVVGKSLSKLINGVAGFFGASEKVTDVTLYGYGAIILKFALKGLVGQDLISSIVFLIIIGQTFGLVITYIKRTFMCIFLGILAPVVVAVDVIQKALKG